jgi:hypothetical protein
MRRIVFSLIAFILSTPFTFAQSTDPANPTAIVGNQTVVKGPKKNDQLHYFSFIAGPGEVTVSLIVKAKTGSTFVGIKVFDSEMKTISYHNMSADTSSPGMAMKKFDVGEKQTVVLSFTSDSSLGECTIKLGGAVEVASLPIADTDMQSQPPTSEAPPSTDAGSSGEVNTSQSGKNKTMMMSILDAVGQRFNIPANGKLRIEMNDGSVQEIDLSQVKKILVKK